MTGRGYNSNYQIVQAPGYVVINMEMMHDSRIIPLDGRPHVSSEIRGYMGDSRGHWEDDTLVVETTNLRSPGRVVAASTGEHLRLIERFSLVNAETLRYEFTGRGSNDLDEALDRGDFHEAGAGHGSDLRVRVS